MATPNDAGAFEFMSRRITPADIQEVTFGRAGLGKRGYDENDVDDFLDRVRTEVTRLIAEKGELRDETRLLKKQLQEALAADAERPPAPEEPSIQAVRILSVAQQTADQYVADAEQYSRRMTSDARERYEELVLEARDRARSILENAERLTTNAADQLAGDAAGLNGSAKAKQELEEQVAYLRAFGEVCRVQLRSYLESLLRSIEDEWGRADPRATEASAAGPRAVVLNGQGNGLALPAQAGQSPNAGPELAPAAIERADA